MGLVANLKTMQQPTSDLSSNQIYAHRTIGIRASLIFLLQLPVLLFLLLLLLIAIQLSNLIIKYYRQCSNLSSLNSLAQLYLRGNELIIIGWTFMHELNILSPLSLARFFLTQQLIYKSKIEKHNISLDIFVLSDNSTSIVQLARNLHLPGEIIFQLHKDLYSFLWIRFLYLCCSSFRG